MLSGAPWIALLLGVGWLLLAQLSRGRSAAPDSDWNTDTVTQGSRTQPVLLAAALLAMVMVLAGWLGQVPLPHPWVQRSSMEWGNWGQLLLWFSWPAWPLVLWTLWRWRRQLLSPHVALPLWSILVGLTDSALSDDRDRALLLALPAFAALAAFALPTLRRSVSALIDWFTLLFFTGCAVVIWVIWVAMQTGVPAQPAANVAKLAPGFQPSFSLGLFVVAVAATLCWVWLVSWRVGRHREAIWKSLVLPAAGATLCWLLLMTLWLPLLDFAPQLRPDFTRYRQHGARPHLCAGRRTFAGPDCRRCSTTVRCSCNALAWEPNCKRMAPPAHRPAARWWSHPPPSPRWTSVWT